MLNATHPGRTALYSHSKTGVRNAAIAPQVEIPLKCLWWQLVKRYLFLKEVERRRALTTADHFAITFRCQHVHPQSEFCSLGIALHVKRLHRGRVMVNHHRLFKLEI